MKLYKLLHHTMEFVNLLASKSIFMTSRKLVLVDAGEDLPADDIKNLSNGVWKETKLVIIGEDYPKSSSIRTHFDKKDYKFMAVKFFPFANTDISGCLSLYALELEVNVSYEVINKIAEHAAGDMRAARTALRTLVASEDEEALEVFLPFGEQTYRSEIQKLFSGNRIKTAEAVETLTPFLSIMILRENILKFLPEDDKVIELLFKYANLDIDSTENLVDLACYLGNKIKTFSFLFYKKPKPYEVPNVDVDCSDGKKILYFRGFEKLMKHD